MTLTRTQLLLTMLASLLFVGCTLVPCNHAFPKLEWYWSSDAIECRKEHRYENQNSKFNGTPAPENSSVLMLGDKDISRDTVSTNATGEITRVHRGWIYRFYLNGGIASITQQIE